MSYKNLYKALLFSINQVYDWKIKNFDKLQLSQS